MSVTIKCPKCGLTHTTVEASIKWRCPNCKMWVNIKENKK